MAALEAQLAAKAQGDREIDQLEKQLAARELAAAKQAARIAQLETLSAERLKETQQETHQAAEEYMQQQKEENTRQQKGEQQEGVSQAVDEEEHDPDAEYDEFGRKKISDLDNLTPEQTKLIIKQIAAQIPDPSPDEPSVRLYDLPSPGDPGTTITEDGRHVWRETDEMVSAASAA